MKKCVFCGWEIPDGKGNDPMPASMEKGAVCCNWCHQNIVQKARAMVNKFVSDMSQCTVAENNRRNAEKQEIND